MVTGEPRHVPATIGNRREMDHRNTSFLLGANAGFLADLYQRYLADPGSVDPSWAKVFAELSDEAAAVRRDFRGASWGPGQAARPRGDGNGALAQVAVQVNGEAGVDAVRAAAR